MTLVLRNVKQTELTWVELDANFTYLDNRIDQVAQQTSSNDIVRITQQSFLPAEQTQARANISAADLNDVVNLENRVELLEGLEYVSYNPQIVTVQQQQIARENLGLKFTKAVFEHTLTASDVANTIMTFALTHTPKMDEWEFLFIGSAPVSPVSYSVSGNTLSIDTSTIGYPMQAGRLVIFRYMY